MPFEPHPELPGSLHKYASPDATVAILQNGSLQFSRPGLFDDDFDVRLNLAMHIDEQTVINGALEKVWDGAYGPVPPPAGNTFGKMILAMRELFPNQPDHGAFIEYMRPGVTEIVEGHQAMLRTLCERMGEWCSTYKVLCLSDSATVAPMWGLYAANISGAVLRFSPVANDSLFLTARPVTYVAEVPVLYDNAGFIEWLSGRQGLDAERLRDLFLYTKSDDWAVQREWRIVAGMGWHPTDEREFVEFAPVDLQGVIFGIRATPEFQETATLLAQERYPNCRIQKLRRSATSLSYEVVDVE